MLLSADGISAAALTPARAATEPTPVVAIVQTFTQPVAAVAAPEAAHDDLFGVADEAIPGSMADPVAPVAPASAATDTNVATPSITGTEASPEVVSEVATGVEIATVGTLGTTAVHDQNSFLADQLTTTLKGANGPPSSGETLVSQQPDSSSSTYDPTEPLVRARAASLAFSSSSSTSSPTVAASSATYGGNHDFTTDGTTTINIGGTSAGSYDVITVSGTATLGGTLAITFTNFTPAENNQFDIITGGSFTGHFASGTGLFGFGDGSLFLKVEQLSDRLRLTATKVSGGALVVRPNNAAGANAFGQLLNHDHFTTASASFIGTATLGRFVSVYGTLSFGWQSSLPVTLTNGNSATVSGLTIGGSAIDAFVGLRGPYLVDSNGDGSITSADTPNANAAGLHFTNVNVGLAVLGSLSDAAIYYAAKFTATSGEVVGLSTITAALRNVDLSVNDVWALVDNAIITAPGLNFSALSGGGLDIPTGGTPVKLDFGARSARATIGDADFRISNFVYVRGSFAFERGGSFTFNDTYETINLDSVTFGASHANVFVGAGGPYWTDLDSNQAVSWAFNTGNGSDASRTLATGSASVTVGSTTYTVGQVLPANTLVTLTTGAKVQLGAGETALKYGDWNNNSVVDVGETGELNARAVGLALQDVTFGLGLFTEQTFGGILAKKYTALKVNAASAGLVGVGSYLTLDAKLIEIAVNQVSDPFASTTHIATPRPAINFGATGYSVPTGTGTPAVVLDFTGDILRATVSDASFQIYSFVYVRGSFAFEKGNTFTFNDGSGSITVDALTVGASHVNVFVGAGGPYWTDLDSNRAVTWAFNTGTGDNASRTLASGSASVTIGSTTYNPGDALPANTVVSLAAGVKVEIGAAGSTTKYGDWNNNGIVDAGETAELSPNAIGLALQDVNVGLGLFTEQTLAGILPKQYTALKVSAASAGLVGFGDYLKLEAKDITVGLNQVNDPLETFHLANPRPAINFGTTGYHVPTGTGTPDVVLDFSGDLMRATVGDAAFQIYSFVYARGSFAFEKGNTFTFNDGFGSIAVDALTIGASNVNVFVGAGGPYWTDTDSNRSVSWSFNTGSGSDATRTLASGSAAVTIGSTTYTAGQVLPANTIVTLATGAKVEIGAAGSTKKYGDWNNNSIVDVGETAELNPNAIGLALQNVNVGLGLFTEQTFAGILPKKYTALKIEAAAAGLVGLGDYLKLEAKNIQVALNEVSDPLSWLPTHIASPRPAINFGTPGYSVPTGTGTPAVVFDYSGDIMRATVGDAAFQIYNFVYLRGSFAFEKGNTFSFNDGFDNITVDALTIGASNVNMFVGGGGPYWTDTDSNRSVSWSFNTGNGNDASRTLASGSASVTIGSTTYTAGQVLPANTVVTLAAGAKVEIGASGSTKKYGDWNNNAVVDVGETAELNPNAIGLALQNVNVGLGLFTEQTFAGILPKKYTTLKVTAASAGLVGLGDYFKLVAKDIEVDVNQVDDPLSALHILNPRPAINFGTTGYSVPTGTGTPAVVFNFSGDLLRATVGDAAFQIYSFIYVRGSFAFEKGNTFSFNDGFGNITVDAVTIGASNVNVFVGGGGPYWTDTDSNRSVSWSFNTGNGNDASRTLASGSASVTIGSTTYTAGQVLPANTIVTLATGAKVEIGAPGSTVKYGDWNNNTVVDVGETAELNPNAIGLALQNVNIGLGLFTEQTLGGVLAKKYTALKVNAASAGLVGLGDYLKLEAKDIEVALNQVDDPLSAAHILNPRPAINFGTPGYPVPTGTNTTPVVLDFTGDILRATVRDASFQIYQFVYVRGSFAFEKGRSFTWTEGTTPVTVDALTVGASHVNVFAGVGGPYWNDVDSNRAVSWAFNTGSGDDASRTLAAGSASVTIGSTTYTSGQVLPANTNVTLATGAKVQIGSAKYGDWNNNTIVDVGETQELNGSAIGLAMQDVDFALGLFTEQTLGGVLARKYTAVKVTAASAGLVGVGDYVQVSAKGITVGVNQVSDPLSALHVLNPKAAINFSTVTGGFAVPTGTGTPSIPLDYTGDLLRVSAQDVTLQISQFVFVRGSFAFEKGGTRTVSLVGGQLSDPFGSSKEVEFLTVAGSHVHAFVGLKGPYWQDSNNDGQITSADTTMSSSIGIAVGDFSFGLALMRPTNVFDPSKYFALKASAKTVSLVGISGITLSADEIAVEVNQSSPSLYGIPLFPVVNFSALPGGKYAIPTGGVDPATNTPITVDLTMNSSLVRAQGFVALNIFSSVYLTGSVAFELGPTKTVTLAGGGTKNVMTMSVGAAHVNAFIGANGPYWTDSNHDHVLDKVLQSGELSSTAVGFTVADFTGGLLVMASTTPNDLAAFVALKASVTSFGLVNMPAGLSATGTLDVEFNVGLGLSGLDASLKTVDLAASFSEAPALFALLDANGDKKLDQTEQTAALAGGYIGQDITTVAQLVSVLNTSSGAPDAYLTINEVRAKLKDTFETGHQAAVDALDADGNGRLNTGYEVSTGNPASPVILDADNFLINVQLGGEFKLAGVFRMNGVFLFEIDSTGLKAFVAAGLEVGPDIGTASANKLFTMNALGALVINHAGIAADVEVAASIGAGAMRTVLSLSASARVVLNTTGVDQIITIPQRYAGFVTGAQPIVGALPASATFDPSLSAALAGKLTGRFTTNPDGSLKFTIDGRAPRLGGGFDAAGSYFVVALHGNLTIARTFTISGDFQLKVSSTGLQLGYNGALNMGGFATVNVAGGAVIEGGVFAAYNTFNVDITVSGVRITGGAVFEINSGSASKTVFDAQGTGHAIAGTTYMVTVAANINLFNVLSATGTVKIGITGGNFQVTLTGTLSFFGFLNVGISGYFNTNGTFSFTGNLGLDLTYAGFGIRGSIGITLNNSGVSGSGSVSLVIAGQNINLASGTVTVNWGTGAWRIRAEGPLSVWLEVSSNGSGGYKIDGGLGFFDDVLKVLDNVADAIAEGAVAAANAVANAIVDLGSAIVQFGQDVVDFFSDVGDAIASAAEAVWDAISGYFEDSRTVVTQYTVTPTNYYQYSTSLSGGTLTINNSSAQKLNIWVVDGNVVVDAPDYTKSVLVSKSQYQERDYEWDGWPPWGQWSDWYDVGAPQYQYANINITNASAFALGSVSKIVINGTDGSETIVVDRNTVTINTDVYGNGGDDVIATGRGNDRVWGGDGNDIIFTYEGNDYIDGGNGNDKLFGGLGNDQLYGGAGDDVLDENQGRLQPGTLTSETNTLDGGSGNDTILGSPGVDTITGGSGNDILLGLSNDDIYVFADGFGTDRFVDYSGKVTLDFSGATNALTVSMSSTGLTANSGSGNSLSVDNLTWIDQLKLGSGNDQVTVTAPPSHLLTLSDAGGRDQVAYDDSTDSANNAGVLTSSRLTGLGMGNSDHTVVDPSYGIAYSNIEDMVISLGSGNDTFTVSSTVSGSTNTTTLNTGAGTDTIHIYGAGDTLTVNAQGDADTINVNGTSAGSVVTLNGGDGDDIINISSTSGTTAANGGNDADTFNIAGTGAGSTTTLNGDDGNDIINVRAIAGTTTANGGNGTDTFNVGSNAIGVVGNAVNNSGGTLNAIQGALTINGGNDADVVNLDETGDVAPNTGSLSSTQLLGLGMGANGVTYSGLETFNLNLGSAGDTFTVISTHVGLTHIEGRDGNDQIFVQSIAGRTEVLTQNGSDTITVANTVAGVSTVNGIQALLVVTGGADGGTDALVVTEANEAAAATQSGTLTNNLLTGLGMAAAGGVNYTEFETLAITLGLGGDTFNVQSTFGATVTTLNTGAGSGANIVNVGSQAPATGGNVNAIAGKLVINGQSSSDTVNVDDTGDTASNTGLLTSTRLTGLGMAANDAGRGIEYAAIETLNVSLGSGADDFTIQTTHTGVTVLNTLDGADRIAINATSGTTTVNAGGADDTINVGSAATVTSNAGGTLNAIQGALTVNGGTGAANVLNLDETADGAANTGTVTSNQVTGLGMVAAGITYTGLATLNLNLGSAGDTLTIASTHAGLTHVEGRDGNDQFFVQNISGLTQILGQNGSDTVTVTNTVSGAQTVNGIQALLVVTGGSDTGTDALVVSELNEAAGASVDGLLTSTLLTGLGMAAGGGVNYTGFETLDVTLGQGNDTFVIASTHAGQTTLHAGAGDDHINIATLSGTTFIRGEAGDDTIKVNVNGDGTERIIGGSTVNGVDALLDLDGQLGSDDYIVYLAGEPSSASHPVSLINVHDTGGDGNGTNFLEIYGTDKSTVTDNFLVRRNFIALLPSAPSGTTAERINYDSTLNQGIALYGRAGDDYFVFDDTSASMTVDGGDGNDTFQIGQMFQSERVSTPVALAGGGTSSTGTVAAGDEVRTVHTTQGYLTPGVQAPTTIYGGDGNDQFIILSNQGPLGLFGEDGDDRFVVRAFALYGSQAVDPNRAGTNINAGLGADNVEYNVNAPVAIDGGDGRDTIVVVGTEFSDHIVITSTGIYGAGLFMTYTGIEEIEVHGAEGNDHISVQGTPAGVVTHIYGDLGSDTFDVGGQAGAVVSRDLQGHSGIIDNVVVSGDVTYSGIPVEGIAADVADNDAPGVVITESGGSTQVAELDYGIGLTIDRYTVVLTAAPTSDVYVTVSAPVGSLRDQLSGSRSIQVYTDAPNSPPDYRTASGALELHFTPANWNQPQTVFVQAVNDTAAEGTRYAIIQHSISKTSATGYAGLALPNVTVKIIDDDVAAAMLLPLAGNTLTADRIGTINPILEGNTGISSQSFALILTNGAGTVTVGGGSQLAVVGSSSFTFTAGSGAQLVTLRAVDDNLVEGAHRGTITATVSGASAEADLVEVPIADTNSPGVIILPTNGSTRVIEGSGSGTPWTDSYSVALTRAPAAGTTVQVQITPVATPTTNDQLLGLAGGVTTQVAVSASVLTFTSDNWSTPQIVTVTAIDDAVEDGSDIQVFARTLQTLDAIRGPLFIEGGIDPKFNPALPAAVLYLGETNVQEHVALPNPNLTALEPDQIDSLWIYNNDAVAAQSGTLTQTRLTGLGMSGDLVVNTATGPQVINGGITYSNLEMFSLYLGKGADTFEVLSTHAGETLIDAGPGNDSVTVRTALGHTTILGNSGDDQITLGAPDASQLTIDRLRGLVTIDGGAGADTVNVDDRADANNNVGTLDTTTLTGLDLAGARVRTLQVSSAAAGTFTITVDGRSASLSIKATAAELRTALLGLGLPGVSDIVVNRADDLFTIGFLADESVPDSALVLTGGGAFVSVGTTVPNRVQTIALPAATGSFTVTIGSGGSAPTFSIAVGDSADTVRTSILHALNPTNKLSTEPGGYGIKDVVVARYGSNYEIAFQGLLGGDRGTPFTFAVAPRSAATPTSFSINAIGGTYRLNFTGSTVQTSPLAWNANAADVQAALRGILASNAITVVQAGSSFTVNFGGVAASLASVDDRNLVAPIAVASRPSGVDYYGVDVLNVNLGRGSDVFNVRGTTAVTNLFTNGGDDRVYVSSLASETLTSVATTDFLPGNLDRILGTLNLDFGDGRQILMISDEAAIAGDGTALNPVRITDQPVAGLGLPPTEITITGLTPAPAITYKASPAGNIADGITIWTGWGADTILVDGTHQRGDGSAGSLRTVTTLNTGLGDDNVTVNLNSADGFFVLNTQGPENAYVGLLFDRDTVDASGSTRPLVIFGGQDDDAITGGQGNDIIFADRGLVTYYNGTNAVTVLGHGGPGDKTDGVERALGFVTTTFPSVGGNDTVYGRAGRDFVFGGFGNDVLDASAADVADDILIGDNGQALFTAGVITRVDTSDTNLGGNDTLTAGKGSNIAFGGVGNDTITAGGDALPDILMGDNGTAKFDPATGRLLEIFTTAPGDAGEDVLTTGDGNSVVLGGSFSDLITSGAGSDVIVGDNGRAVFDPTTYRVTFVTTTVPEQPTAGGRTVDGVVYDDVINAGAGNNVILGGSHSDLITTLGGGDLIVGDNGNATLDATGVLRVIQTSDPDYGGNDRILAGTGADVVLAGSGNDYVDSGSVALGDVSRDIVAGDNGRAEFDAAGNLTLIYTTVPGTGGDDTILIGGGDNVALGGVGNDTITAGDGNDVIVGDNGSAAFDVTSHTLANVHTTDAAIGGADTITAGNGNNVVLGGTSSDTITTGTGDDIVLGDSGEVDYVVNDQNPADIDVIASTDFSIGGVDTINTGAGADIVIGGQAGDVIDAGVGNNIVFGDSARILAALADAPNFSTQPLTIGLLETLAPGIGGADQITTGTGRDIIFGGTGTDTITANAGETVSTPDGDNIVLGDDGLIDYVRAERELGALGGDTDPADIDLILSTNETDGGVDQITTGNGSDIVIGGQAGDTIAAGNGSNLVIGDSGSITAAADNVNRFATQPIALGLIQTTAFGIGGADTITTGTGTDLILGGHDADTIAAGDGDNIVAGDDAAIEYVRLDRTGAAPGADSSAADIDLITSLSTDTNPANVTGGADTITTGVGNDIVIGGRYGDTINAGPGNNIVIGDSGIITAANESANRFGGQGITVGRIETTAFGDGGADNITTLGGSDVILGGHAADTINAGEGDNVVLGDDGALDYVRAERDGGPGADTNATDIDLITSLSTTAAGGSDTITTGAGNDIVIGGRLGDAINAGTGNNVVIGDSGRIIAATSDASRFATSTVNLLTVGRIENLQPGDGGDDTLMTGIGRDIILGGTGGDTIVANQGETTAASDADDIVLGDDGVIDYVRAEREPTALGADFDPADIDLIASTDFPDGGRDIITTGNGSDLIIAGRANDSVTAGHGSNVVIGDSGIITAAGDNVNRFATQPIAMGWIESTAFGVGGADSITTGDGNDFIIGGHDADTIIAGNGDNVVAGDDAAIDYVRQERAGTVPGADFIANDIDLITSLSTNAAGGADQITTGTGNDIVIGGRYGDTIAAGAGNNIVIGDSGEITAASENGHRFGTQLITVGRIETTAFGDGGADTITTLGGIDVILGGHDGDTINAGDGDNVVLGDDGEIDYVRLERTAATPGADLDASDIDLILSTSTTAAGGADTITTGSGNDLIVGGRFGDTIVTGDGNNIAVGDSARITAVDENAPRFGAQAISVGRIETIENADGGADTIRAGSGQDVLMGGAVGDRIDGGAGDDLIVGDNATLDRTGRVGNFTNALFEALTGGLIYDNNGNALVTHVAANQPGGAPVWGDMTLTLLDHSFAEQATSGSTRFGNDYIAGGAGNDPIFGGLGDDTIQGDGSIDLTVSARRLADGTLQVVGSVEAATDGDDYIEGNGGSDLIFGGLGQDDIIGGSSSLFGLNDRTLRPDGADLIFGGAGTDIAREDSGDLSANGRARDADTIVGDNGNIYRLVGTNGVAGAAYLTFGYDNFLASTLRLIPHAVELIDYTPGGADVNATNAAKDIGAGDEIHGESGNDTIYGGLGNDVLFGDAQDDDIIGGTGNDWISAGNGDDGVLGDDGRIFTSRNGTAEPLYGIAAIPTGGLNQSIGIPSRHQQAIINVRDELKKTAIVEPFTTTGNVNTAGTTPANDIIFGGLGDDALHGGAGDDAISGAEAMPEYYAKPVNSGDVLGYNKTTGEFAAYNENAPSGRVYVNPATGAFMPTNATGGVEFILNFVTAEQDGNDVIFGDTGNDWLVGGRGNDNLYGGYGDDLMNVDDIQETTTTDPSTEADLAFGGAGRDILIGNAKSDRLIDWNGEFNSYIVPFQQFGEPAVSRELAPALMDFLYSLSASDGADPTRALKAGTSAARNGEPYGEIGLVKSGDADWGAQQGAPADPQPGNGGGGGKGGH